MRHADLLEKISGYNKYLANGKFRSLDFFIQSTYVDVVGSREVAKLVEKQHKNLLADIRGYIKTMENTNGLNFQPVDFFIQSTYKDDKGETRPCYLLTKKGCDMVANKMTGEKGVLFTAAYVTAFEKMRDKMEQGLPRDYPSALRALRHPSRSRRLKVLLYS